MSYPLKRVGSFGCPPLKIFSAILFLYLIPQYSLFAALDGGEVVIPVKKPSEFELERMVPRTDFDMLSANLAGENISLADGGLSFSATDILIPVNMPYTPSVSRVYNRLSGLNDKGASAFGDWQLDLPQIESTVIDGGSGSGWSANYAASTVCRNALNPGDLNVALGNSVKSHEYWNGATLTLPGEGGGKLLEGSSGSDYETADNILVNCATDNNGNEFFIVKAPSGLTYTLKRRTIVKGKELKIDFKVAARNRLLYLVTEITDRFGNELSYQYIADGLRYIEYTPTGGAIETLVTFNYTNGLVSRIDAQGKSWNYEYQGKNLSKVTLPDDTFWLYEFPSFVDYSPTVVLNKAMDWNNPDDPQSSDPFGGKAANACNFEVEMTGDKMMKITHPRGAVTEFDFKLQVHGRTEVPAFLMVPISPDNNGASYNLNSCYGSLAISQKRLRINAGLTYSWDYNYTNNGKHWNISNWNTTNWGGY